jgi:NAD(P)-dependent dehydrogenase (short-subunit alcohol dehydrogenase family)
MPFARNGSKYERHIVKNQIELRGRRAIVTGGSRGMGRAIAQRLLESGATVTLWALEDEALLVTREALGSLGPLHCRAVDVSDNAAVVAATAEAAQAMGGIDILVNSAGISGPHVPVWEYPVEDWRRVMEVNLNGAFYCCRAVVPHMKTAGYGRIVNVASVAGKEGSPLLSAYSAAKAGMIALTKTMAKELAMSGVLVNAIAPGPTRTDMFDNTPPEQMQAMLSRCPMQRLMEPEEVAASVAWLVSDDCSFTTGAVHDLSGGRSTY